MLEAQRGSVQGSVQGMQGLTPYARWAAAWGSAPLWVLGVVFALLALLGGRRAGPRA